MEQTKHDLWYRPVKRPSALDIDLPLIGRPQALQSPRAEVGAGSREREREREGFGCCCCCGGACCCGACCGGGACCAACCRFHGGWNCTGVGSVGYASEGRLSPASEGRLSPACSSTSGDRAHPGDGKPGVLGERISVGIWTVSLSRTGAPGIGDGRGDFSWPMRGF